ncbi:hypothetical protein LUZ61_015132 [Rhynchospora tenuis]|uniref:Ionotropic glutamate receptor C-terminal domain-containing protein n=1 Tax=Rhynchospora tenuis TaxID=198213 RepID=A0AAD5WFS3_9POAL|nr:hypothetical protein LUZ61_015132 [Rhynchospora tenuis]
MREEDKPLEAAIGATVAEGCDGGRWRRVPISGGGFRFGTSLVWFATARNSKKHIPVGVILDLDTLVGKIAQTSIAMAVEDFYSVHSNYSTRLELYTRDSNKDDVQATLAALDLLQNFKTEVIIGPQKSSQAVIVSEIGNKSHVPVISFSATSPTLSSMHVPYFIRTTINDAAQVNTITALIKAYGWAEVVPIYEDSDFGRDMVPFLADALEEINVRIPYRCLIPELSTDDQIKEELYKLQTMQTRVFVVHMSSSKGSTLFMRAKEVGMMNEGYVWIMTNGVTNMVDSFNSSVTNAMKGALGVRLYVPKTVELNNFSTRWKRRFHKENPQDMYSEPSIFGLWAYDTMHAIAMAVEKIGVQTIKIENSTVSQTLPVFPNGEQLLKAITNTKFQVPKGWQIPVSGKKLRVGVTIGPYPEFMKVEIDPETNATGASGYSIDVFEEAVKRLPYAVPYEYKLIGGVPPASSETYNDFVYQVYLGTCDLVIGDITIRYNRTRYADFTIPYTESGIAMIVPVEKAMNKNTFIFLMPLTTDLWLGSIVFFTFTGITILILEPKMRASLKGSLSGHLGTIVHLSLFAYQEKLENLLSKIVVIVWVFVLLVLTSSYTASLTSMLTVQQLQPTVTDIHDLQKNGEYVGYETGSFVEGLLQELKFDKSRIRVYQPEEFAEALGKGSANGGVAAIVHEIPYIKLFLAKNCKSYTMVGPIYKTAGFGFVSLLLLTSLFA